MKGQMVLDKVNMFTDSGGNLGWAGSGRYRTSKPDGQPQHIRCFGAKVAPKKGNHLVSGVPFIEHDFYWPVAIPFEQRLASNQEVVKMLDHLGQKGPAGLDGDLLDRIAICFLFGEPIWQSGAKDEGQPAAMAMDETVATVLIGGRNNGLPDANATFCMDSSTLWIGWKTGPAWMNVPDTCSMKSAVAQ